MFYNLDFDVYMVSMLLLVDPSDWFTGKVVLLQIVRWGHIFQLAVAIWRRG